MATNTRWLLPNIVIPNYYFQVHDCAAHRYNPPWFFKWFPRKPCFYCDSGVIANIPHYSNKVIYFKWTYIQLNIDAVRVGGVHGLNFEKGDPFRLPLYIRKIVKKFLNREDKSIMMLDIEEYERLRKEDSSLPPALKTEEQLLDAVKNRGYRVKGYEGLRNRGEKTTEELYKETIDLIKKEGKWEE